jgi:phosphoribosylanthranilate isomerase
MIVKICGLSTPETLAAAIHAGADMIGLNFHPKSPRYVPIDVAADLAAEAEGRTIAVALLVDPDDDRVTLIRDAVNPRMIQLHGQETPERVREIRALADRPVIKALGISHADDLAAVAGYARAADLMLLDAKPPKDAAYPGGHGRPFDWSLLAALPDDRPFLLSGGLTPDTVGAAIGAVRALGKRLAGVDVSSGVETAPGVKQAILIEAFTAAVRRAG